MGEIAETTDPGKLPVNQKVVSIMGEMGRDFDGSYAEYTLLPNSQIYPVSTTLSWKTLATVPETYYTAYGSMLNLKLSPTDQVIVRGASSGIGVAFLKLAKASYPGIKIIGSTRAKAKVARMKELGFDDVVLDQDGKLQTSYSYSKAFELVGPATIKDTFHHISEGGIVCSTGQLGNQWYLDEFDPIMDLAPNSYLTSFYPGNVSGAKLNELLRVIENQRINVKPVKVFSLKQVPEAYKYLESHHSLGKVIVLN